MNKKSVLNGLKNMLEHIDYLDMGLCFLNKVINFQSDEVDDLFNYSNVKDYLNANIPNQKIFFNYKNGKTKDKRLFWWKIGEVNPRKDWLKEHIAKLEKELNEETL